MSNKLINLTQITLSFSQYIYTYFLEFTFMLQCIVTFLCSGIFVYTERARIISLFRTAVFKRRSPPLRGSFTFIQGVTLAFDKKVENLKHSKRNVLHFCLCHYSGFRSFIKLQDFYARNFFLLKFFHSNLKFLIKYLSFIANT